MTSASSAVAAATAVAVAANVEPACLFRPLGTRCIYRTKPTLGGTSLYFPMLCTYVQYIKKTCVLCLFVCRSDMYRLLLAQETSKDMQEGAGANGGGGSSRSSIAAAQELEATKSRVHELERVRGARGQGYVSLLLIGRFVCTNVLHGIGCPLLTIV